MMPQAPKTWTTRKYSESTVDNEKSKQLLFICSNSLLQSVFQFLFSVLTAKMRITETPEDYERYIRKRVKYGIGWGFKQKCFLPLGFRNIVPFKFIFFGSYNLEYMFMSMNRSPLIKIPEWQLGALLDRQQQVGAEEGGLPGAVPRYQGLTGLPPLKTGELSPLGQCLCPVPALTGGGKTTHVSSPRVKEVCVFPLLSSSILTFLRLRKNKDIHFQTWFEKWTPEDGAILCGFQHSEKDYRLL